MHHPYETAPKHAFWSNAVASTARDDFENLFIPKFSLRAGDGIATAGSCFAQHIGHALKASGCSLLDVEPAPRYLDAGQSKTFGYGIYSARYGNIYTARQMRELLEEAILDSMQLPIVWSFGSSWVDALRPTVEPEGLLSIQEVVAHRALHLCAVWSMVKETSLFIFTLGMTETWVDRATQRALPLCPGVIAGTYSDLTTYFENSDYSDIISDLNKIRSLLKMVNPKIRLLLTVSPVPLTATASGRHALTANAQSKSTLRSAAGNFADSFADVDYFPSYEIITSPAAGCNNFEENLRYVKRESIDKVMDVFLRGYGLKRPVSELKVHVSNCNVAAFEEDFRDSAICDEMLVEMFVK